MDFDAGNPPVRSAEPSPRGVGTDKSLRARRYLEAWGLREPTLLRQAAERLTEAARDSRDEEGAVLVSLAGRWVESFARRLSPEHEVWFWRAPDLLSEFGAALLETPIPELSSLTPLGIDPFVILPRPVPSAMMQQAILDPVEGISEALQGTTESPTFGDLAPRRGVEPGS